MKVIYEPKGRAREYAELACNFRTTCQHGCTFCYCPAILHKSPDEFHVAGPPREGILDALRRDCEAMQIAGDTRRVFFHFIGDPYEPTGFEISRDALLICEQHGIPFSVCTKGGWRARRDFDVMKRAGGWFGTTLTCWDETESAIWEPLAAPPHSRADAITEAHYQGIYTWVSLEPVLDPQDALAWIGHLKDVVDLWRVGRWNHDARANEIDWARFALDAQVACMATGASFLIKKDLAMLLPAGTVTEYWAEGHGDPDEPAPTPT